LAFAWPVLPGLCGRTRPALTGLGRVAVRATSALVVLTAGVLTASSVGHCDRLGSGLRAVPRGCFLVRWHFRPGNWMVVGKLVVLAVLAAVSVANAPGRPLFAPRSL
jgi:hypothetical protein